jgi:cobyrinic acid a,c-diamide synthase
MVTPRVVIAGTHSGVGKTTIAVGIMAALKARGIATAGFKVGPDFIDPSYHSVATGRPPRNLDAYLQSPQLLEPLFQHGCQGGAVGVIEGVMGLFDGKSGGGELASTAHVAKMLAAPVVLVVDGSHMARSVAALVSGFANFDPEVRIAGVVLNKVGSRWHEQILREALKPLSIPVVGAIHRRDPLASPERHLGLIPAPERARDATSDVTEAADTIEESLDLDLLLAVAWSTPDLTAPPWQPGVSTAATRVRVAVAGGACFSFMYQENLELLRACGAEVMFFDPLFEGLPDATDALYLGGGFPEAFTRSLSDNAALKTQVREFCESGGPVIAECGGLIYLASDLDGYPMCGVIDARVSMTDRLTLGYREAVAVCDSPIAEAGALMRGHEFHYSAVERSATHAEAAWVLHARGRERAEGFSSPSINASYLHTHWAATPKVAERLVREAARWRAQHPVAVESSG